MRSKNVHWHIPLTSESHVYGHAKEGTQEHNWQEYDVGCFQSVCIFFSIVIPVDGDESGDDYGQSWFKEKEDGRHYYSSTGSVWDSTGDFNRKRGLER